MDRRIGAQQNRSVQVVAIRLGGPRIDGHLNFTVLRIGESILMLNVSLRPELENLVNENVRSGEYRSNNEVLNAALQLLKERDEAEDRLEGLLQEAEGSGEPTDMTRQDWDDIRREVDEHYQKRKAG